mgnify:CR=1 FL=1
MVCGGRKKVRRNYLYKTYSVYTLLSTIRLLAMAAAPDSARLTLEELPVDVLGEVASYLSCLSLVALMGTCQTIRQALMHDALVWRVRFGVADYEAFVRGLCAPPGTVVAISSSNNRYTPMELFDLAVVVPGANSCGDAESIKRARASRAVADAHEMIAMLEASGVASAGAANTVAVFHDHVNGGSFVTPMAAHLGARMMAAAAAVGVFVPDSIYSLARVDGDDDPLQLGIGDVVIHAARAAHGNTAQQQPREQPQLPARAGQPDAQRTGPEQQPPADRPVEPRELRQVARQLREAGNQPAVFAVGDDGFIHRAGPINLAIAAKAGIAVDLL